MKETAEILNQFEPISLEKLLHAELMDRVDTKFLIHQADLPQILAALIKDYHILEVNNQRMAKYENLYFDTPEHRFYLDHHNKKDHRFKIRFRKYDNSQTNYFEIKERRKNRTSKKRIQTDLSRNELTEKEHDLVREILGSTTTLHPTLQNHYHRITLVSELLKERFTLDLGLTYQSDGEVKHIDNVVVAELKQYDLNRNSPVFKVMNQKKIRPFRFSKYCIGTVLLLPKEQIKYNNFKFIIQKLNTFKNAV